MAYYYLNAYNEIGTKFDPHETYKADDSYKDMIKLIKFYNNNGNKKEAEKLRKYHNKITKMSKIGDEYLL